MQLQRIQVDAFNVPRLQLKPTHLVWLIYLINTDNPPWQS